MIDLVHFFEDGFYTHLICPEQHATPVHREAVAVDPDDVHIQWTGSDTFFQDFGTFVHHHVHATLQNFLVADLTRGDAVIAAVLFNNAVHSG